MCSTIHLLIITCYFRFFLVLRQDMVLSSCYGRRLYARTAPPPRRHARDLPPPPCRHARAPPLPTAPPSGPSTRSDLPASNLPAHAAPSRPPRHFAPARPPAPEPCRPRIRLHSATSTARSPAPPTPTPAQPAPPVPPAKVLRIPRYAKFSKSCICALCFTSSLTFQLEYRLCMFSWNSSCVHIVMPL